MVFSVKTIDNSSFYEEDFDGFHNIPFPKLDNPIKNQIPLTTNSLRQFQENYHLPSIYNEIPYILEENNNDLVLGHICDEHCQKEIEIDKHNYMNYFSKTGKISRCIRRIILKDNLEITENVFLFLENVEFYARGHFIEIKIDNYLGLFYLKNSKIINLNIKQGRHKLKSGTDKSWILRSNSKGTLLNCSCIVETPKNYIGYYSVDRGSKIGSGLSYLDRIDHLMVC